VDALRSIVQEKREVGSRQQPLQRSHKARSGTEPVAAWIDEKVAPTAFEQH
jgi:hypothetical protein